MTAVRVTAMMRKLTLDAQKATLARGLTESELSDAYGLSDEEAKAIVERRLDVLHRLGVHEVTLMQIARTFSFSIADRWAELKDGPG